MNTKPMPNMLEAMTPFPYSIQVSESIHAARNIMNSKNIRHLPVVEGDRLIGVLTDRDVKLSLAVCEGGVEAESDLSVGEVCILDPYVVPHTEKLDVVANHMATAHIGSALIVRNGKLVGIFTVTDACAKLAEVLKLHYPDA